MSTLTDAARRIASTRPALLLAGACAVQVAIGAAVALASTHNGFVWYSGGDDTEYWTDGWVLAHHALTQTHIGPGIPLLYAWLSWFVGPNLVSALPVITLLQLVIFVPLAALLVWAIADLLFGRAFAWWALAFWIVAPLLLMAGFQASYATEFRDDFLAPHWYGLTEMADMPSLVAILATTWAMLRMAQRRTVEDAVLAGALMGALVLIKPANGFFAPAALVLLLVTRNIRTVGVWCLSLVPGLAALTVWKAKGLGSVPLLALAYARESLGAGTPVAVDTNRYVHLDWPHFTSEMHDLAGSFWSLRVLEFILLAGLLAALRRAPWKGAFLGLWCVAFVIVKGSNTLASVSALSYYRFVEPGLPAVALLAASIVLLIPRRGRAFAAPASAGALPGGLWTAGAAVAVLGLLPLVFFVATPPAKSPRDVWDVFRANNAPISGKLDATVETGGGAVRINWQPYRTSAAAVYYVVLRAASPETCTVPGEGGSECDLAMKTVGYTRSTTFVDHPPAGPHWYRIGMMANYTNTLDGSDLMLIGKLSAAASAH